MTEPGGRPGRRGRRTTIADVAALAGVSVGAVSQVFNGTGRISLATAERVREAASKLNWTPSNAALALRHSRSRTVGLVLNRPGRLEIGPSSPELISGIESVLAPRKFGLLLYLIEWDAQVEEQTYRDLSAEGRIDGVILTDSRFGDSRFALMRSLGVTAALLGTPWGPDPTPHVDADPPGAGIDDAVGHLVDQGHRRIAYVGGPSDRFQSVARHRMFEHAMRSYDIAPVAITTDEYAPEAGAVRTGQLLELATPPTAIMYGTDPMALGGLRAARERNVKVPDELSVVGFDGMPVGEWVDPQLTTVQRDHVQRGRAVASLLMRLLGEDVGDISVQRPYLVVRGSTAPPTAGRRDGGGVTSAVG